MGFGLLLFGYFTVLGTLPSGMLFGSYAIIAAFAMSLFLIAALKLLSEYNLYFKITFIITIVFSVSLLISIPFEILKTGETVNIIYSAASRVTRYIILLAFHNFLLQAIRKLAQSIENEKIAKKSRRNLIVTYVYFIFTIASFFDTANDYIALGTLFFGIFVFLLNLVLFYSCYMRITYEGHDEEIDRKYNELMEKRKKKK